MTVCQTELFSAVLPETLMIFEFEGACMKCLRFSYEKSLGPYCVTDKLLAALCQEGFTCFWQACRRETPLCMSVLANTSLQKNSQSF